jgi:allantoicase
VTWVPILQRTKLSANNRHFFEKDQIAGSMSVITHVKLTIYPDGGVSRLRLFGYPQF